MASPAALVDGALAVSLPEFAPLTHLDPTARESVHAHDVDAQAADNESSALNAWRAILARVRSDHPAVAATLELAAPLTITPEKLVVGFEPGSFEDGRATESDARSIVALAAAAHFATTSPHVHFDMSTRGAKLASVASLDAAKRKAAALRARAAVERHPLVQAALTIFNAELKDIRLPANED